MQGQRSQLSKSSLCLPLHILPHHSLPSAPAALIYKNSRSKAHLQLGFPTSSSTPSSAAGCLKRDFLNLMILQGLQRTEESLSRGFQALSQSLAMCKWVASCPLSKACLPLERRNGRGSEGSREQAGPTRSA